MNEPATKEDVENLRKEMHERFEQSDRTVEGMRGQNSAEHGSLFSKLTYITELMIWIKVRWEKFTRSGTWPGDSK